MKPRLLDLFCGAGGCSVGYHRAGFEVVGVDIDRRALRDYPYQAIRADAMDALQHWDMSKFDVVHASPPCQHYTNATGLARKQGKEYPDLLPDTLRLLDERAAVWVVENVPGARRHMTTGHVVELCGSEFNLRAGHLGLRRHRLFASNVLLMGAGGHYCKARNTHGRVAGVYGHGNSSAVRAGLIGAGYVPPDVGTQRALLGIEWMRRDQLTQAIPPAYTQHIGEQLIDHLRAAA